MWGRINAWIPPKKRGSAEPEGGQDGNVNWLERTYGEDSERGARPPGRRGEGEVWARIDEHERQAKQRTTAASGGGTRGGAVETWGTMTGGRAWGRPIPVACPPIGTRTALECPAAQGKWDWKVSGRVQARTSAPTAEGGMTKIRTKTSTQHPNRGSRSGISIGRRTGQAAAGGQI